jgi:prolycopene isomerase
VKYQKATLERAMAEHIHDVRLKAVFSTLWPYLGLPPSRLSFIYWSAMLMSFLEEGAFYCRESFQKLADAYVEALQKHGGELLLNNRVRRILVKNAQATGVQLENGQKIRASIVISNADAQETFAELVNPRALPSQYQRKLARLKPSLSAFVVYMATKLDLKSMGAGHEMFFYRSWNHEQCFQTMMEGKPAGIVISIPSLVDPSLAPPGEQVLSVITLIPYDLAVSWRKEKSRYAELLLSEVESVFPGLRENLTFAEGASPRTMERYTLNLTGAIYGWEPSPGQVGRNRLSPETPVHGLYLSGHWTRPGGGIYAVTMSGAMVAQRILGLNNLQDLFQSLSN